jgi:23S rRNA pseudouridine1911/1915/1917 synthase
METRTFTSVAEETLSRLDLAICREMPELSRSTVQRLIDEGRVTVNGRSERASLKLKGDEEVCVIVPDPVPAEPVAEEIPLEILYEDADLVVINKPAGMVVHQGAGNSSGTLVNALLGHCDDLSGIGGELRPGIVHRIDKDTSGILVAAKNDRAHQALAEQFRLHSVKRLYRALIFGRPLEESGRIESEIGRHPVDRKRMSSTARHGKRAVTRWKVLARYERLTFVELRLETGRTHQIRVHLSEKGHPLVGDEVYGGGGRLSGITDTRLKKLITDLDRQALHAMTLGFIHPVDGRYLEFTTPLPDDIQRILDYLETK